MLEASLLAAATVLAFASAVHAQAPAYTITKSVPLCRPDRWNYVVHDAASHRVYVAHTEQVAVIATIPTAATGRTMDVDPQTGRLFVAAADVDPAGPADGRPRPLLAR